MGLVMGSIFFDLSGNEINNKFGVLFFAVLYLGLGDMAQLPAAIESRNVFYEQHAQVRTRIHCIYTLFSCFCLVTAFA
jgi:branched-subunit amino acid permease